jgi:hypothetical protein
MRGEQVEREPGTDPDPTGRQAGRGPWRAPVITRFALARTLNAGGSPVDTLASGIHP